MPKMTRSHYNLIADTVANFSLNLEPSQHLWVTTKMTEALAGTSSQFKADRFRERCMGVRRGR